MALNRKGLAEAGPLGVLDKVFRNNSGLPSNE
jgi:hypothetical protein